MVSGKRQQLIETVTSLTAEGASLNGLREAPSAVNEEIVFYNCITASQCSHEMLNYAVRCDSVYMIYGF